MCDGLTWGSAPPYPQPRRAPTRGATGSPFVYQKVEALQSRHEIGSFGGVGRFSPLDGKRGGGAGFICRGWTGTEITQAQPPAIEVCKGSGGIQAGADGVHAKKVQAREIELPWAIGSHNVSGRRIWLLNWWRLKACGSARGSATGASRSAAALRDFKHQRLIV